MTFLPLGSCWPRAGHFLSSNEPKEIATNDAGPPPVDGQCAKPWPWPVSPPGPPLLGPPLLGASHSKTLMPEAGM